MHIYFESVPVEYLDTLEKALFQVLRKVADDGIDMTRMATVVKQEKSKYLLNVERYPSMMLSSKLINQALYGSLDGTTLKADMTDLLIFEILAKWDSAQWVALLQKWWLHNPHVTVLGKPSAQLAESLEKNELARVEAQKEKYGEEGLANLKRKLEAAQEENDKPIPQELIRQFKIPRIENVKFINTINAIYRSRASPSDDRNEIERYLDADPSDHPLHLVFSHTTTQFVTISLYITTKGISGHLLPYLELYLNSFFSLPIERDGEIIDYEDVVREINEVAVEYTARLGVDDVSEVMVITLRTEKSQYERIVRLLSELFVHSVFDPERYSLGFS